MHRCNIVQVHDSSFVVKFDVEWSPHLCQSPKVLSQYITG